MFFGNIKLETEYYLSEKIELRIFFSLAKSKIGTGKNYAVETYSEKLIQWRSFANIG